MELFYKKKQQKTIRLSDTLLYCKIKTLQSSSDTPRLFVSRRSFNGNPPSHPRLSVVSSPVTDYKRKKLSYHRGRWTRLPLTPDVDQPPAVVWVDRLKFERKRKSAKFYETRFRFSFP